LSHRHFSQLFYFGIHPARSPARPTRKELDKILDNIQTFAEESDIYQAVANNFFADPSALCEGRLYFGPMTRM
jgi:hypothetical protein